MATSHGEHHNVTCAPQETQNGCSFDKSERDTPYTTPAMYNDIARQIY